MSELIAKELEIQVCLCSESGLCGEHDKSSVHVTKYIILPHGSLSETVLNADGSNTGKLARVCDKLIKDRGRMPLHREAA